MTNPNGHGGRRPGAGRPKSKSRLVREAAEQLLRDLPQFRLPRQSADQVVEQLGRLTATVHRLREDQRSDRENLLPIPAPADRDRAPPSLDRNAASATAELALPDGRVSMMTHSRSRFQVNRFLAQVDCSKPKNSSLE